MNRPPGPVRLATTAATLALAAAALLAVGACRKSTPPRPRLVPESEIDALRTKVRGMAEANRTRSCPRPVLRGEPTAGTADDDIVAVLEGAGDTRPCLELLEELSRERPLWFSVLLVARGEEPGEAPLRAWRTARPPDDPALDVALARRVAETCGPLLARLRAAVAHGDACSPYLPGRRCATSPPLAATARVAKAAAATAYLHLRDGAPDEAVDLLLDALRFAQDLGRGGASFIWALVDVATVSALAPVLESALSDAAGLDAPRLVDLERRLGVLLDGEPHPGTLLEGEYLASVIDLLLPQLGGAEGIAPGDCGRARQTGKPAPGSAEEVARLHATPIGADERDDTALAWAAADLSLGDARAVCPPTATPRACRDGLEELTRRYERAVGSEGVETFLRRVARQVVAADGVAEFRAQVTAVILSLGAPTARYVGAAAHRSFLLAAARLGAACRRLAIERGVALDLAAFDAELAEVRVDPWSGGPLAVRPLGPGRFVLSPPAPLRSDSSGDDPDPALVVTCAPPAATSR